MSRITWGDPGTRDYEAGVDRGVFYPTVGPGLPWNGLIGVQENPTGLETSTKFVDGVPYRTHKTRGNFSARIQAYAHPLEFAKYDGPFIFGNESQSRKPFNLSYRTKVANDLDSEDSYLIHLVYNAVVSPSARNYTSIGSNTQPTSLEWELNTIPEFLPDGRTASHLVINSKIAYPWALNALENVLYGSTDTDPRFPSITEILNIFEDASILRITDNGDGTWTADGPDDAIIMFDDTTFQITWPSAIYIDSDSYLISSL